MADDPASQGLLSLGLRLMSTPGNFGTALGTAGLGAMGDLNQATQAKQRRDLLAQEEKNRAAELLMKQQQMQQLIAEQQRKAAIDAAYAGAIRTPEQQAMAANGGPTMTAANAAPGMAPAIDQKALIQGLMKADPMAAYQMLQPKPADYKVVGDALVSVGPQGVKEAYRAPAKPEPLPSDVRAFQFGQQNPEFNEWKRAQAAAGATRVNVDAGQRFENAYSSAQGKSFSETMENINRAGFTAPAQIRKLERMTQLLEGVDGGRLAPLGLEVASAANSIGIKIDPKLGNKEASQALAREIAGGFRQPGTGPMTDKDFENFLLQVPDLAKSAEGRQQITSTMRAALNRDIQLAKMAREYERKNGKLDGGFMDEAAQFIAENPVVGNPQGWQLLSPQGRRP